MHAAATAQPENSQSFTFCFAIDYLPGEDHTLTNPPNTVSGGTTFRSSVRPGPDRC
jgi:hypothetical protein